MREYNSFPHRHLVLFGFMTSLVASPAPGQAIENLLLNPGFEQGTLGWAQRGGAISTSTVSRSGARCGHATNRTATWQGIKQSLLGQMTPGQTVAVSAWIMLDNAASDTIVATFEVRDDNGVRYIRVDATTGYNDRWTRLSGDFTLNAVGTITRLDVYFEGPAPGVAFFLDDVEVLGERPVVIPEGAATDPYPVHGSIAADAQTAIPLNWSPGEGAARHDVYLGKDRTAVENATTSDQSGLYQGTVDVNHFSPAEPLESLQTYYWRVDEVKGSRVITRTKGIIWQFTVGPERPHLKELAAEHEIWIGPAVKAELLGESAYVDTIKREFNLLTPENDMKWGPIHPQREKYNFAKADAIVDFAQANGMDVHGHALVWHNQNPDWLTTGQFSRSEMIDILRDHIHTVVGRYAGRIAVWDVVNEVIRGNGGLRDTLWLSRIGPEYIDLAFQFAHEADPDAILVINDYSIEPVNSKSTGLYTLVRDLQQRDVPIHAVGFQMHLRLESPLDYRSFADNMRRFADLGLQIYVTEMDVRILRPVTEADWIAQAGVYRNVIDRCLAQPAFMGFQTWGFTDKYSWIQTHTENHDDALIFDRDYMPKPAFYALKEVMQKSDAAIEDFEAGDFSLFDWERSGDASWWITRSQSYAGERSGQAGDIEDGEQSTLRLTIQCISGDIQFYVKVSSEANYDELVFQIDGAEKGSWSGSQDWIMVSHPVSAGTHTFEWRYEKDSSDSDGEDTAWLDDITFPLP